jgi:hypothetical protein
MGFYCCCDAKISAGEGCSCNWEGWTKIHGPDDRPKISGTYLVRVCDNSADKWEQEMEYSVKPYRMDKPYYGPPFPIHWKDTSWDGNVVYAWKPVNQQTIPKVTE